MSAIETNDNRWVTEISPAEQIVRRDVAACYRLIAYYGLSDLSDGFVGARIPDAPEDFIVGGYGLFPELAAASTLHRRVLEHEARLEKLGGVDVDAHHFTATVLGVRPEFNACIHAHTIYCMVLSSLDCELWPMTQWGIMYDGRIAYLPFESTDVTSEETCKNMADLFAGGIEAIILRNHGIVVGGRSVSQAFFTLQRLEQACRVQVEAMQTGQQILMPSAGVVEAIKPAYWKPGNVDHDGVREWPGFLAILDGLDRSYRD